MKKFLLFLVLFFSFAPVGFCADSQLFRFMWNLQQEVSGESSNGVDYNGAFTWNEQLNWINQPWFNGGTYWEVNQPFELSQVRNSWTDNGGNIHLTTYQSYLTDFTIQLPHSQFCDINKDCRIDFIIRFYDFFGRNDWNVGDFCDSNCISGFRDNFILQVTDNYCDYKTAINGVTSDIGVSCYSPKGQEIISVKFISAFNRYTTWKDWGGNYHRHIINTYISWPSVVEGDSMTDLVNGGFDIFNSNYTYIIGNNYDKFNTFNLHSTTISNLVLLPVNMLRKFLTSFNPTNSDFCPSFHLGNWFGTDIYIPCISLSQYLGNLWNVIDVIFSAFIVYRLSKTMITAFNNFTILKEDMSEVWK